MKLFTHLKTLTASLILLSTFSSFGAASYETEINFYNKSQKALMFVGLNGVALHLPAAPAGGLIHTTARLSAEQSSRYFLIEEDGVPNYLRRDFLIIFSTVNSSNTGLKQGKRI